MFPVLVTSECTLLPIAPKGACKCCDLPMFRGVVWRGTSAHLRVRGVDSSSDVDVEADQ